MEFPTDIVFQVVVCRLCYQLSLRDLAELFLLRGFVFTPEAVREWEERFAPLLAEQLRRKRSGKVGRRWFVDEMYLKVKGKWCYLYRAIDKAGNLVDSMLSLTRDMAAAQQFFRKTLSVLKEAPQQVTTDGHDSYPRAIREILGPDVRHRNNAYLNRRIEQDHRGIKQRYYPTLSFGAFPSAQRFCCAFEEIRQYFRPRRRLPHVTSYPFVPPVLTVSQVSPKFPEAREQTPQRQWTKAAPLSRANVLAAPQHSNAIRGIAAKPGNCRAESPPLARIPQESFPADPSGWRAIVQTRYGPGSDHPKNSRHNLNLLAAAHGSTPFSRKDTVESFSKKSYMRQCSCSVRGVHSRELPL